MLRWLHNGLYESFYITNKCYVCFNKLKTMCDVASFFDIFYNRVFESLPVNANGTFIFYFVLQVLTDLSAIQIDVKRLFGTGCNKIYCITRTFKYIRL